MKSVRAVVGFSIARRFGFSRDWASERRAGRFYRCGRNRCGYFSRPIMPYGCSWIERPNGVRSQSLTMITAFELSASAGSSVLLDRRQKRQGQRFVCGFPACPHHTRDHPRVVEGTASTDASQMVTVSMRCSKVTVPCHASRSPVVMAIPSSSRSSCARRQQDSFSRGFLNPAGQRIQRSIARAKPGAAVHRTTAPPATRSCCGRRTNHQTLAAR